MNSFTGGQAALLAQILCGLTRGPDSCMHNINRGFSPCDLPFVEHEQHHADTNCCAPVSNPVPDGINYLGGCNVTDGWWQHYVFEFESLPEQVHESNNYSITAMPEHGLSCTVGEYEDHARLSLPVWERQPDLTELYCRESPVKRLRNGSFYELDDILKSLPPCASESGLRPAVRKNQGNIGVSPSPISIPPSSLQFSSEVSFSSPSPLSLVGSISAASSSTQHFEEKSRLQSYPKRSYVSLEPQSIAARRRRIIIREKICSLEKLIPQDSKLDISRKLEEAAKYVKFLQAQVKILECMPLADSKTELEPSPNDAKDNAHSSLTSNALTRQRSVCLLNKLSRQQMLYILLASPRIQRKLFSAEKVICTVHQMEMLSFSTDFSNFHDD